MADFVAKVGGDRGFGTLSLTSVGFDPPIPAALRNFDATQCTKPEREAVVRPALRTVAGSERWRPEQTHPGHPRGPRSRSRPSFRMRFRCANLISIFLRSCRDRSKLSVPANDRATSRACVDRIIVLGEIHLLRVLKSYAN